MVRHHIQKEFSSYYPPRARWYSRLFYLADTLLRKCTFERLRLPSEMRLGEVAAGLAVPGLAVYLRGPRTLGQAALSASALLALVFIVWLGHPAANVAFGLLISVHSTGFVYYCGPATRDWSPRERLAFTVGVLLFIGVLLYMPARDFVQNQWLRPLQVNGQVMVVRTSAAAQAVRRGDWVAYDLQENQTGDAHNGGAIRVVQGVGLGPVLAVAGDRVSFSTNEFAVNGLARPRLPHMPASGELVLPAKHWFVWPRLELSVHGNVSEASVMGAMLELASVSEGQFIGKPFRHWFWRRQVTL